MSGMLDAVKLIQSGYPTRIPYADIHSNPNPNPNTNHNPKQIAELPEHFGAMANLTEVSLGLGLGLG